MSTVQAIDSTVQAIDPPTGSEIRPLSDGTAAQRHIRRSSVLLVGRVFAVALNFASQVLLVRYLSRTSFGAFSYALAVIGFVQGFATFEMTSALARWVPIYRERRQPDALYGSVVMAFGFVTITGLLIAAAIILTFVLVDVPRIDPESRRLVIALAILIPMQSLDALVTSIFSILGDTRAIVIRGSIIAPALRVALVGALVIAGAGIDVLAYGYLLISGVGLAYYACSLWRALVARGLLKEFRSHTLRYPARDIFGFASPLVVTVLVWSLIESSDTLLLGYFHGVNDVAAFRAVLPLAQLNRIVVMAFQAMYLPAAARLFVRGDRQGLSGLYWQTAMWMAVLSFPPFVCTFSFATPTAAALFGTRYLDAAPVLSILSLGYFFNTALGFNGLTLKTFNKVRITVGIDIAAVVLNVALNLVLIPRWGAVGAASGTCATLIVHNLLKQIGLRKFTNVPGISRSYLRVYGMLLAIPCLLLAVQRVLPSSLWVALPLSAIGSLLVFWAARSHLAVGTTFPELERWAWWRLVRRTFSSAV
jgi:O-antigen/teichoic acid export membrane protein